MTEHPGDDRADDTTGAAGTDDNDTPAPDADESGGGSRGVPDGPSKEEAEAERDRRLDPENRPDGAEVDNTDREFDVQKGMFKDTEGYDQADETFPPAAEQDT